MWIVTASCYAEDHLLSKPKELQVNAEDAIDAINIARGRMLTLFGYDWLARCQSITVRRLDVAIMDTIDEIVGAK